MQKDEVASYVNDYFINIGRDAGTQTPQASIGMEQADPEGWLISEFTESEVYKVVKTINTSKSSGLNNISSFIMKEVFEILNPQLTFYLI